MLRISKRREGAGRDRRGLERRADGGGRCLYHSVHGVSAAP